MDKITALKTISHWEKIKELLNREDSNIYADPEIYEVDKYLKQECEKELNGESST